MWVVILIYIYHPPVGGVGGLKEVITLITTYWWVVGLKEVIIYISHQMVGLRAKIINESS